MRSMFIACIFELSGYGKNGINICSDSVLKRGVWQHFQLLLTKFSLTALLVAERQSLRWSAKKNQEVLAMMQAPPLSYLCVG